MEINILEKLTDNEQYVLTLVANTLEKLNVKFYFTGMRLLQLYYDIPFQTVDTDIHIVWTGHFEKFVWETFHEMFSQFQKEFMTKEFRVIHSINNLILIRGKGVLLEITSHPISNQEILKFCRTYLVGETQITVAQPELTIFGKLLRSDQNKDIPVLDYIFNQYSERINLNNLKDIIQQYDTTGKIGQDLVKFLKNYDK